jgi:DNA polymerase III sliding clamp (beta) subunit (PCNA family)
MNMLEKVAILKMALSDNAMVPALKCLSVVNGDCCSSDGRISIMTHVPELEKHNFVTNGTKFAKAVDAAGGKFDKIELDAQVLNLKAGRLKVKLPLLDVTYPDNWTHDLQTAATHVPQDFVDKLRELKPFIGNDASRPWCCGVLYQSKTLTATNNVIIAQTDVALDADKFNLPGHTIETMLAINECPTLMWVDSNRVIFSYASGFFLSTRLLDANWPDVNKLIEGATKTLPTIPDDLSTAIQKVLAFCPDTDFQCIVFDGTKVATTEGETSAEYEGLEIPKSRFRAVVLESVLNHATHADFSQYPNPIPFQTSDGVRGVFTGVR